MARTIELVAVTGTNGKTSVVSYAQQLLTACGRPAASYGSLGVVTPTSTDPEPELPPDDRTIPALIEELDDEVEVLVFEATSFALARGVLDRLRLRAGVFTNLAQDHLDVHGGSMSVYLGAKSRLFTELLPASATAILGDDDASGLIAEYLAQRGMRRVRVGGDGDLLLRNRTKGGEASSRLRLELFGEAVDIEAPVVTDFQVTNLLFALAIALDLGIDPEQAIEASAVVKHPPGRFEVVGDADGVALVVDYAHNPHALATVLRSARELTDGRVGVVFGCGGERDRDKRAPMGRIARELADVVVVTDDNARREDPAVIRRTILDACPGAVEVADRAKAVEAALADLSRGDVLVLAGRGDERVQEIGDVHVPRSDRDLLHELAQGER